MRGLAVLLVLLGHGGFLPPVAGAVGVAVFFVLSGFLITRVIVEARHSGTWSYPTFLGNRAARLVPALALMVTLVSSALLAAGLPVAEVVKYAASAMLYAENIVHLWFDGRVFTHTWSLAVEEQFYLVWPFVLPFMLRARRPLALLTAAVVVSAAARVSFADVRLALAYSGPVTNAYALLIGCGLALFAARLRRAPAWVGPTALSGIFALAAFEPMRNADIYMPVPAAALAALLVWASLGRVRLLEAAPLRFLGRISYAAYLWHWPLLYLTGNGHAGTPAAGLVLGVALVVATASTLLFEEPLRARWRQRVRASSTSRPPVESRPAVSAAAGTAA